MLVLVSWACWIAATSFAVATTIPAGTPLVARTLEPISSHERVGAVVKGELEQDVVVSGTVVLRAGTPVTGVVETSFRRPQSSGALTVNLKAVSANGRSVPVHTTGACKLERFKTKSGVSVSGREYSFPYRTRMVFRLAQPLKL